MTRSSRHWNNWNELPPKKIPMQIMNLRNFKPFAGRHAATCHWHRKLSVRIRKRFHGKKAMQIMDLAEFGGLGVKHR
jgi:hypothetical protein